jgi:hypothetical protein
VASGGFSISRALGAFRFMWMPFGLCALAAVGVHAAADAVDDRILVLVERLDVVLDGWWSQTENLQGWVDVVGSLERTRLARLLALIWELAVDLAIAIPALAWKEREPGSNRPPLRDVLSRLNRQPTPTRFFRPLAAIAFAGAGAFSVSRMVETALYAQLTSLAVPAELPARIVAAAALALIFFTLGARLFVRTLEHADGVAGGAGKRRALAGVFGTALAVPLAIAALIDATPILSLFR